MNNKVKVKIEGKNPNYYLKELIKNKINIYNLEIEDKIIKIIIDYNDYKKIKKTKTTYKLLVINYYGISKIKHLLKKYYISIIFIIVGLLANIILSNMIFKIEVKTSNKRLSKIIINDLKSLGIKKYRFKVSFDKKEKIKEYLKEKEKEKIEWIEIEEKGNIYIIKIEERKIKEESQSCNYRNIVSKKNALITKITSSSGEIVKKKNDYVTKGEVLISGLIHNKDEIVSKRCSIGKVYGETWYKVKVSVPEVVRNKKITNNKKIGLTIKILNKEYNLFNKYKTFEKKEYNIIESKIIPLKIAIVYYIQTKEKINKYNINNVDDYAEKLATKKIKNNLKNDEYILSRKTLKKSINNSKIDIEVFVSVNEDITDYQDITDININEMNKKEE